jgi:hypothetical protein
VSYGKQTDENRATEEPLRKRRSAKFQTHTNDRNNSTVSFIFFTLTEYFLLSAADLGHTFSPMDTSSRRFALWFTGITILAGFASMIFPIYAFFVMPWWQPLAGGLLACCAAVLITRTVVARSWLRNVFGLASGMAGLGMVVAEIMR